MEQGSQPSAGEAVQPARARGRSAGATRAALLRAAAAAFAERGFAGARVDEIAARARVNKRMIYVHFGDKRRLFREVLRGRLSTPRTTPRRETDARSALRGRIAAYFRLLARDPALARLLAWAVLSSTGRREQQLLLAGAERGLRPVDDVIRRGIGAGSFRADVDPGPVRSAILAACLGYFLQHEAMTAASADRAPAFGDQAFLEGLCRVLLDGILSAAGAAEPPARGHAAAARGDTDREREG